MESIRGGSSTEWQQSQMALSPKTLRAAGLLSVTGVGLGVIPTSGDYGDAPAPLSNGRRQKAISDQQRKHEDNHFVPFVRSRGFDRRGSGDFAGRFAPGPRGNGARSGVVENHAVEIPTAHAGQRVDGSFHREPSKSDRGHSGLVSRWGQGRSHGPFRVRALV